MINIIKDLCWLTTYQAQSIGVVNNPINRNSYPINNKRGHAAKQKREAKKAKRK